MNDLQLQIDLLVDGELSEDERRELLLRLEREPDGWRTCALALLEAETLRESLGSWADGETAASQATESRVENVTAKDASFGTSTWLRKARPVVLAVAASLLVGFFIGERLVSSGLLHKSAPTIAMPEDFLDEDMIDPVEETPMTFAETPVPDPDETEHPIDSPWKLVSFYGEDSEAEEPEFELPCREAASPDDVWADDPMTFANSLAESLQAPGRNVQVTQRHWSVPADDGSTIIVPVEEIVVSYPSLDEYQ